MNKKEMLIVDKKLLNLEPILWIEEAFRQPDAPKVRYGLMYHPQPPNPTPTSTPSPPITFTNFIFYFFI